VAVVLGCQSHRRGVGQGRLADPYRLGLASARPLVQTGPVVKLYPVDVIRIYNNHDSAPGARVLVDRLWPRGVSRERARLDAWCRDVAPSTELRAWYGHQPELYAEFRDRYLQELGRTPAAEALQVLRTHLAAGPLHLLTATKTVEISNASVLAELLRSSATGG
jgi:uncharacterized protein YeaO (DUF488 family)